MNRPRIGIDDFGKLIPPFSSADAMIRAYQAYLGLVDDYVRWSASTRPDRLGTRKSVGGRTAYGTGEGGAPRRVTEAAKKAKRSR